MMNSDIPYLTIDDKIATEIFDDHPVPAFIVEGKDDYYVYGHVLTNSNIDWSRVDFVVANGKSNIMELIDQEYSFNYVALVDADYDRFDGTLLDDPHLIYTHYHSLENYLTLEVVIAHTISDICVVNCSNIPSNVLIDNAINSIKPLIVACFMKHDKSWPLKIEDCGIENDCWWSRRSFEIDSIKMFEYLSRKLSALGVSVTREEWDDYNTRFDDIKGDRPIDLFVRGKHKLEAIYYQFKKEFPFPMENRTIQMLFFDLCKNLSYSSEINELLDVLNSRVNELLSTSIR